jgi:hypothetical protein
MYRHAEGEPSLSFRLADPNRDHHQDSHPLFKKIEVLEDDVQGHAKKTDVREVPTLSRLLKVANGVNSSSATVFSCVFDIAKSS